MKLKNTKTLVAILFLIFGKNIFAQNISAKPDNRLYEVFDKAYIENLSKNHPDSILFYQFYLDNSYSISQLPQEKMKANINNFEVLTLKNLNHSDDLLKNINDKGKINILKYNFQHLPDQNATYVINEELGYIIVFYSQKRIAKDFQEFLLNKKH